MLTPTSTSSLTVCSRKSISRTDFAGTVNELIERGPRRVERSTSITAEWSCGFESTSRSRLPALVSPVAKYHRSDGLLAQGDTDSATDSVPTGQVACCSTMPPPPSISTTTAAYAESASSSMSKSCAAYGSTVKDWTCGSPSASVSTVSVPRIGSACGLTTRTVPPVRSSVVGSAPSSDGGISSGAAGTPGQYHVLVRPPEGGTAGIQGDAIRENTGSVNPMLSRAPATSATTP